MGKKKGVLTLKFPPAEDEEKSPDEEIKETVDKLDRQLSSKSNRNTGGKSEMSNMAKAKAKHKEKQSKKEAKKESKSNGAGENTITLAQICSETKCDGAALRKALRDSKIAKPGDSWRWPVGHKDVKAVKDLAKKLAG